MFKIILVGPAALTHDNANRTKNAALLIGDALVASAQSSAVDLHELGMQVGGTLRALAIPEKNITAFAHGVATKLGPINLNGRPPVEGMPYLDAETATRLAKPEEVRRIAREQIPRFLNRITDRLQSTSIGRPSEFFSGQTLAEFDDLAGRKGFGADVARLLANASEFAMFLDGLSPWNVTGLQNAQAKAVKLLQSVDELAATLTGRGDDKVFIENFLQCRLRILHEKLLPAALAWAQFRDSPLQAEAYTAAQVKLLADGEPLTWEARHIVVTSRGLICSKGSPTHTLHKECVADLGSLNQLNGLLGELHASAMFAMGTSSHSEAVPCSACDPNSVLYWGSNGQKELFMKAQHFST